MSTDDEITFIIDDDPSVRKSLARLLNASGYVTETFASVTDFLKREHHYGGGCLVLDIYLPDMSGLEAGQKLMEADYHLPTVFVTGYGDVPTSVRAMKGGAVDFLTKPVTEALLLNAVRTAFDTERQQRKVRTQIDTIRQRMALLTPREREVLDYVVAGQLNKQIAAELGLAEKTVKVHRARVMRKMGAATLVELVRAAHKAGVAQLD